MLEKLVDNFKATVAGRYCLSRFRIRFSKYVCVKVLTIEDCAEASFDRLGFRLSFFCNF